MSVSALPPRLSNGGHLEVRPERWTRLLGFERVTVELRHHVGVEHIMFATDYPHIERDWPNTRQFAEWLFADVPAEEAVKIAAGNIVDFFGLGDTPVGRTVLAAAR